MINHPMNRDASVTISLIVFLGGLLAIAIFPFLRGLWLFLAFVIGIRMLVLWFQTLIHAAQNSRVGWVICHVLFGNLASIIYFYMHQEANYSGYEKYGG